MEEKEMKMMETILRNQKEMMEMQRVIIGKLNNLEEKVLRVGSDTYSNKMELDEIRSMVSSLMYR